MFQDYVLNKLNPQVKNAIKELQLWKTLFYNVTLAICEDTTPARVSLGTSPVVMLMGDVVFSA